MCNESAMKMGNLGTYFCKYLTQQKWSSTHVEGLLQHVQISAGQRYLEVGCGSGAVANHIAKKYPVEVIGIDVDPVQIQTARRNAERSNRIRFFVCDMTNLPFDDRDFDIVASFGVMHSVANWANALEELERVLRPGGYFIFSDFVYPGWIAKMGILLKKGCGFPTPQDVCALVQRHGFSELYSSISRFVLLLRFSAVYRASRGENEGCFKQERV